MKFIISSLVPLTKLSPLLCEQVCKLSLKLKLLKLKLLYMVVHLSVSLCYSCLTCLFVKHLHSQGQEPAQNADH